MGKRLRRKSGRSWLLLLLKRFCTSFPLAASGSVSAHAGAGHGSVKRCSAGREVLAVAVSAGTTAAAAAGTAGAAVLSVRPSEKWETLGQR